MAAKKPKKLGIDELAGQYGYAATFFLSDRELKALITRAVKEQWSPAKFQSKFQATRWYRSRGAGARQWAELNARDPAEAQARRQLRFKDIAKMASQMGIVLSGTRATQLANQSFILGWDETQLKHAIGAEFRNASATGRNQGEAATLETFIKNTANDFGVTISHGTIGKWVGGTLMGNYTQDGLVDFIRDVAKSKYPGLNAQLDKGFTVRQVAEPYIQSYAQILETSAETVQMTDPRIQRALQGAAPATPGGVPQAQTLYDFERDLRKDPRWRKTKNARDQMTNAALGVLQDMGIYS